jgi:hypothetical protein
MTKILFVGNSYTFFSDLPKLFRELAEENGKAVDISSVTKGGWSMVQYLDNGDEHTEKLNAAVENASFDAVILQDQSVISMQYPEKFRDGMTRMKAKFEGKADRVILYQTWARKNGNKKLEELGWTRDEMHNGVTSAYRSVAAEIGAELSPVGECFYSVYEAHPEIEIYNPDGSHPSYAGSCLAAICHYRTVFGELPKNCDSLNLPSEWVELFNDTVNLRVFG